MQPPTMILTRIQYLAITVALIGFIIYGSLVPLRYRSLSYAEATAIYSKRISPPVTFESRSDWLANILLFVPLGFSAAGFLGVDRRTFSPLWILAILLGCLGLSATIEFVQLWFPQRVTSLNDIVAETIGGAIGIGLWCFSGQAITDYARSLLGANRGGHRLIAIIPLYLVFLVIVHGMPFDLTISPGELYAKYKQGRVVPIPFTTDIPLPQLIRKALINAAYFLPGGILFAAMMARRQGRPISFADPFLTGLALTGATEAMQLLVFTRHCDATDIVTGTLAFLAGWYLYSATGESRVFAKEMASGRSLRAMLLMGWLLVLAFVHGQPFDFCLRGDFLAERWQNLSWIPFQDYYQANYLYAFTEMLEKIALFIPVGLFFPGAAGRTGAMLALGSVGGLAVAIEVAQMPLPSHSPGISDVILQSIGGMFGWALGQALANESVSPSQAER